MDGFFQPLFDRAFSRVPAKEANAAIQAARDEAGGEMRSYEATFEPGHGLNWLSESLLPRMVYHLESLGVRPPEYAGIFLSLFVGDELLLLHMNDVMSFVCDALGVTDDQIYARWGTGESRSPVFSTQSHPIEALPRN